MQIDKLKDLILYQSENTNKFIEVLYDNEDFWLTQKTMAELFNVKPNTISYHLNEVYESKELIKNSTNRKIRQVQKEGNRNVKRNIEFYSLDAIISVGYRVNSRRATEFRRWATQVLKKYTIEGYALDKKRMENGAFLNKDYFEKLLEEIREIRLSERRFYQKITDIYATSLDYDAKSPTTIEFFKKVQNKTTL